MAPKKKQAVEKEVEQAPVELPVQEIPVEALTGTCIQCRHLQTGQWYGPRCTNPASPEYKNHRPDSGTCEMYEPKGRAPQPVMADDGLYDPEPVQTPLEELLARETEAPQEPDNV